MFGLSSSQSYSLKIVISPWLVRISCIGIRVKPGKDSGEREQLDNIGGLQCGRLIIKSVKVPPKQGTKNRTTI